MCFHFATLLCPRSFCFTALRFIYWFLFLFDFVVFVVFFHNIYDDIDVAAGWYCRRHFIFCCCYSRFYNFFYWKRITWKTSTKPNKSKLKLQAVARKIFSNNNFDFLFLFILCCFFLPPEWIAEKLIPTNVKTEFN